LISPSRPVYARASRRALIVASVPELTIRTFSTDGTIRAIASAILTSAPVGAPKLVPEAAAFRSAVTIRGWPWPKSIGPHDPM
jgi:hypothetical protein